MGPYIADFCCHEKRLIVEIDGGVHKDRWEYDHERDLYFADRMYTVVRVSVEDVEQKMNVVLKKIQAALTVELLPLSTSRGEGAGG